MTNARKRWRDWAAFYHDSVILNVVCPTVGVLGGGYLILTDSDSLPSAAICVGFVGLRAVGPVTDLIMTAVGRTPGPPR